MERETVDAKELNELSEKNDKHWDEVMALAKKYGFITVATAGTAILVTNRNQIENYGYKEYKKIQEMNSVLKKGEAEKC